MFEPISNAVEDTFQIVEQIDTQGDVARVTPCRQELNCVVTFYPTGTIELVTFPDPCSRVIVTPIADLPCPQVYLGTWSYVGGRLQAVKNGLMTMRLNLRRWNTRYAGNSQRTQP